MFENLMWTCHICKVNRPDDKISVRKHPLVVNGIAMGEQNIRYCNDNPTCVEESETFRFVE